MFDGRRSRYYLRPALLALLFCYWRRGARRVQLAVAIDTLADRGSDQFLTFGAR